MADSVTDPANLSVALTAMANGVGNAQALAAAAFAASADRRTSAADQLASDSQRMWSIAMTTPTVNAGLGFRTATESGAGRTRLEANRPEETGAAAPAKVG
ncbi:MAG: hypothetical protein PHU85_18960 [Phycisphaerae bacterium]|nr:hypothetical protein [Phycisphaerae bacterium]